MQFKDRMRGIRTMEKILLTRAEYMGLPTFEYKIGKFTVDMYGNVLCDDPEMINQLELRLADEGIGGDGVPRMDGKACVNNATAMRNLLYMIYSRQLLINKSVGYEAFKIPEMLVEDIFDRRLKVSDIIPRIQKHNPKGITVMEDRISITGLPDTWAYNKLADAMIRTSMNCRCVNADLVDVENEKYYARAWLLRIGLTGKEGKAVRDIFMKNLKGDTAFRTRESYERWLQKHENKNNRKEN